MTGPPPPPYEDDAALLEDAMLLVGLRLQREVAVTRALRGDGRREQFLGLFLSDAECAALLDELVGRSAAAGTERFDAAITAQATHVTARLARSLGLALQCLARTFALTDAELDLLLMAAAPAIDARFGRVYGFLHDDMAQRAFTLGLAQPLFEGRLALPDLRALVDPDLPLRRYRLLVVGEGPSASAPLGVDERVVDLLMGRDRPDPALAGLIEPVAGLPPREPAPAPDVGAHLVALEAVGDPEPTARALAGRARLVVHRLDWRRWRRVETARVPALLAAALRDARLADALPVLVGFEAAPDAVLRTLVTLLEPPGCLATGGAFFWAEAGLEVTPCPAPAPGVAEREAAWDAAFGVAGRTDPALAADLARAHRTPTADIARLARQAARSDAPLDAAVAAALDARAAAEMAAVAERVPTAAAFDDLVLPAATLALLHDFLAWRRHGRAVLEDWGLGRAFGREPGATALFAGPSGTGKTMAAGVVAAELRLPLYRVDLAGTVSKYIGETEKNLERIFTAAARAEVVLFFDEADALFGKRSEVADSHDRYANIEISYLLQRMERHAGLTILATNLSQNLDEAFLRRLDTVVEFAPPRAADRERLWRRLATTRAPLAADVDFALLAKGFELTGGSIRNAALAAAHLAAAEGEPIAMRHLMRAVARELAKLGKPVRKADFGGFAPELRAGAG